MPSIDLSPLDVPYFPRVFLNNQFFTKTEWPPSDTNLSERVAIVTGANVGLGLECARQLLSLHLSHLIIAVRSIEKGEAVASDLRRENPEASIDVWMLDMSSYESVQAFVSRINHDLSRLDIAILNAGQYNLKFRLNPTTGHEETIQVNYLSTALLAILLLPVLKDKSPNGEPGRLTIVNAALAYVAKFTNRDAVPLLPSFDDPNNFDPRDRYPASKLLGHLFLYKLKNYVAAEDVIVNLVCPGLVKGTALRREWPKAVVWIAEMMTAIPARTVGVGASTYTDAVVTKGKKSHGSFLMSWKVSPFVSLVYQPEGRQIAERLWDETLEELGFADVRGILASMILTQDPSPSVSGS